MHRRRGLGLISMIVIDSRASAGCLLLVKGLLRLILIGFGLDLFTILDGKLLEVADDLLTLLQVELRFLVIALLRRLLRVGNSLLLSVFLKLLLLSGYFVMVGPARLQLLPSSLQIPQILLAVVGFLCLLVSEPVLRLVDDR